MRIKNKIKRPILRHTTIHACVRIHHYSILLLYTYAQKVKQIVTFLNRPNLRPRPATRGDNDIILCVRDGRGRRRRRRRCR